MDLELLSRFLVSAEELNLGRAAQRLFISQSALSRQMMAFEQELGVNLLVRDGRSIRLTPAGERLMELGPKLLSHEREVVEAIRRESYDRLNLLSFVLSDSTVNAAIVGMREENPGVTITVTPSFPDQALVLLREGQYHAAFTPEIAVRKLSEADMNRLGSCYIKDMRLCAVVSSEHRLAQRDSIRISDLQKELLVSTTDEGANREMQQYFESIRFRPACLEFVENLQALRHSINKRSAVALLFDITVPDVIDQAVILPIEDCSFGAKLFYVWNRTYEKNSCRLLKFLLERP